MANNQNFIIRQGLTVGINNVIDSNGNWIGPNTPHTNSAFDRANTANVLAQSAFNTANLKFNTSGGTISGNVQISGNLSVFSGGSTFSANTNSTSITSGTLIITGGVGVSGNVFTNQVVLANNAGQYGSRMYFNNATSSIDFVIG